MYYTRITHVQKNNRKHCHCWGLLQICVLRLKVLEINRALLNIVYAFILHLAIAKPLVCLCLN